MISTPKSDKYAQGDCESTGTSPQTGHGFSGHKASFRSTKLARRARSFKEDILEKFSQIRSPGGTPGIRSQSPKSRSGMVANNKQDANISLEKSTTNELNIQLRQVQVALKHFQDVISKNKLEILPGNGTVVLETVSAIHTALKHCLLNDEENNSTTLSSAIHQVYKSLARLLELCDDVLLHGDKTAALESQNVTEVVQFFENSIQNLVELSQNKMANRETQFKTYSQRKYSNAPSALDLPGQRNSLPDIPLTPRERQILEQKCGPVNLVRNSHSSESILRDTSPPPKPPLPDNICFSEPDSNSVTPPPIPPKKRGLRGQHLLDECNSFENSLLGSSFDRISVRSRSPEDSSSLLSASAGSLDSVLMQSRDDDEKNEETILSSDISDLVIEGTDAVDCAKWTETFNKIGHDDAHTLGELQSFDILNQTNVLSDISSACKDIQSLDTNRLSNTESGFGSFRSSMQSYSTSSPSKRSSQQSANSTKWNMYSKQTSSSHQKMESFLQTQLQTTENVNFKSNTEQQSHIDESSSSVIKRETSVHSFTKTTMSSTTTVTNISELCNSLEMDDIQPPELPVKTRSKQISKERRPSQYDNVPDTSGDHLVTCAIHQSQTTINCPTDENSNTSTESRPPPLPPKKKHIMAYMEMFGNCSHSAMNNGDFLRHSMHTYNMMQTEWHSQDDPGGEKINFLNQQTSQSSQMTSMSSTQSCSFNLIQDGGVNNTNLSTVVQRLSSAQANQRRPVTCSPAIGESSNTPLVPPALPPKKSRANSKIASPSVSPTPIQLSSAGSSSPTFANRSSTNSLTLDNAGDFEQMNINNIETRGLRDDDDDDDDNGGGGGGGNKNDIISDMNFEEADEPFDLIDWLDVTEYLILKKQEEDGPDIRGGHPDALIVHATKSNKNDEKQSDFKYQEAFLTTYRTFLTPLELVRKLQERHQRLSRHPDTSRQRAARESFSLLVSVVSDLTVSDLDDKLLRTLMKFVYQLVCNGDLIMAKALRVKILEKYFARQLQSVPIPSPYLTSISTRTSHYQLLDFKSEQIAEQMTLLDAELFMRIQIPEVLIWAQEQKEERSPNLTCFTEHFNKMSYWARSRILEQTEAKDRERYVVKFIKIMKYLRKMNNFNSYLALLSALDSAPIRRLEWQKQITEGLKEYCALIDSSSSFRAYRQALAETNPPCIPYIGLILQDLTFVHIGNSDLLPDGSINFSKRWQQYNIVDNMKRFKKGTYPFKKQERIIQFFNNFDDFLCEEKMWQISESIKPRGGRKQQS